MQTPLRNPEGLPGADWSGASFLTSGSGPASAIPSLMSRLPTGSSPLLSRLPLDLAFPSSSVSALAGTDSYSSLISFRGHSLPLGHAWSPGCCCVVHFSGVIPGKCLQVGGFLFVFPAPTTKLKYKYLRH